MDDKQIAIQDDKSVAPGSDLTVQQRKLLDIYSHTGIGARAAAQAGYNGDYMSLAATASRIVNSAKGRAYLDALYRERHLTDDALLALVERQAQATHTPFVNDDGVTDLSTDQAKDNLGLVRKVKQKINHWSNKDNSEGETIETEVELHDPQKAQELLMRARGMLRDRVEIDDATTDDQRIERLVTVLAAAARRAREQAGAPPSDVIDGEARDVSE